jgi:MFS transporter, PHS family, inorganic phosphate transporter
VAFCGLSLNSCTVLTAIGYSTGSTVYKILYNIAAGNCILVCAGISAGTGVPLLSTYGIRHSYNPLHRLGLCIPPSLGACYAYVVCSCAVLLQFWYVIFSYLHVHVFSPHLKLRNPLGPNATTFIVLGACFPACQPHRAKLAPSLPKPLSPPSAREVPPPKMQTRGKTTSCRSTLSSCS